MAEQNMAAANDTYSGFLAMVKYGTIATTLVAAFVVLLIAS